MVDTIFPTPNPGGYTPRQGRQTLSVGFAGATAARPLGVLTGVRPGTSVTTVTATTTTVTCGPFAGTADVQTAAEAGGYEFAFEAATTFPLTAQSASIPRSDIVFVTINDNAEDGSGAAGSSSAVRGYLAGTTVAIPAAPARSTIIAVVNVPIVGSSPTVTWVAPYAVAAGAPMLQPTLAALNAIAGTLGQFGIVHSDTYNNGLYSWTGAAWAAVAGDTGWTAFPSAWATVFVAPRLRRLGSEVVLTGSVGGGTGLIGTLPTGFRPTGTLYFITLANTGVAQITVAASGAVTVIGYVAGGTNAVVSLDGIRFPVS